MREDGIFSGKFWWLRFGLVLSLLILLAGTLKLSLVKGVYYSEVARDNKVLETTIPAPRAEITDRKGRIVAKTTYEYFKMENGNKIYSGNGDFGGYKFEGKTLAYELSRTYPYGESMSMITGYVGKVSEDDIKNDRCGVKYSQNDLVGRGGIEDYLDCQIRGKNGRRVVEVDALGNYIRELGRQDPEINS